MWEAFFINGWVYQQYIWKMAIQQTPKSDDFLPETPKLVSNNLIHLILVFVFIKKLNIIFDAVSKNAILLFSTDWKIHLRPSYKNKELLFERQTNSTEMCIGGKKLWTFNLTKIIKVIVNGFGANIPLWFSDFSFNVKYQVTD